MKKLLSLLLCFAMVFSYSSNVFATDMEFSHEYRDEQNRVAEVVELRGLNSDTYLLSDGTYECVVYPENKYYIDSNGKYKEINNDIVSTDYKNGNASYRYVNAASDTHVYFSEDIPSVLIQSGQNELAFSLLNSQATIACVGGKDNEYGFTDFNLQSENCISYMDVYEETDFVYSVNNGYVKEYIILNSSAAPSEFLFECDTSNCSIRENNYGTLNVYGESGKLAFEFSSLFAVDSNGKYTDALKYEIVKETQNKTIIKASIDLDYLNAPDRLFPVLIDPTVVVTGANQTYDTYVSSKYPTTNYYLYNWLRTGRDNDYYVRRSYIKFDLPTGITNNGITSAYINMKYYSGSTPSVKAYRTTGNWASNTLTWNNKPGYTTTDASANASLYSNNWYRIYVTNIVKGWYAGSYNNYGFVLKDNTESDTSQWTTFYSSDAASPNKPELSIIYKYYGTRPYQNTSRRDVNCMGYALEYPSYITGEMLNLSYSTMSGMTTSQLQAYIAGRAETWINYNIGSANYGTISNYNSDINDGWYRIILRVGFVDADGDNVFDESELFDYHWWYQTNSGDWADKIGWAPSQYHSGTYNSNPALLTWQNGSLYYNSTGKFYQVKDIRNVTW